MGALPNRYGIGKSCERMQLVLFALLQGVPLESPETPKQPPAPLHLSWDAESGFGAPTGLAGMSLEIGRSWYGIRAGFGWQRSMNAISLADPTGPQWALMPLARAMIGRFALGAGVGLSGGRYAWTTGNGGDLKIWVWDQAFWFNFETFVEYHWRNGLELGISTGIGRLFNPRGWNQCIINNAAEYGLCIDEGHHEPNLPYVGMRFGYSFQL